MSNFRMFPLLERDEVRVTMCFIRVPCPVAKEHRKFDEAWDWHESDSCIHCSRGARYVRGFISIVFL